MADKKIRVALLFGGKSAEHEVSLRSARNIADALDKKKYAPILIGIDKKGSWHRADSAEFLLNAHDPKLARLAPEHATAVSLIPESKGVLALAGEKPSEAVDVVFPILHGPMGEDGTVQGLLRLAGVPFVGAGVLGSAVGMDKDVMKRLLRDAGIPIGKFFVFRKGDKVSFPAISKTLGLPLFIKPANMGSSVGVSKVRTKKEFDAAVLEAFRYDTKILCEQFIKGREIECSVLGNDKPIASVPGEIVVKSDFYSYDAKYIDESGAALEIPAKLPLILRKKVQDLAIKTFKTLECAGLARVDFFLTKTGKVYVNEINTIPGFTSVSMYPKLWEASGIAYSDLIDRLLMLALEKHAQDLSLETSR
ncbi:MAG: D-alanine--D-alanine ligase [Patescibacteria group bacterium]